ncbi:Plasmodium variant antigen protein Cir/Yir/Bir, putative [Plasmodium chabaudi adami]|uniref:Plasmodium variant antigen protein Cir/Yir/Bir, putative n=1 Tax=Plasmodium chabaudi adami TaxID=5826 RepID=A0A1D3LA47_PLACE|nr:Plasmodium variant antigen protein Cir/Yir/Bir, putative [Plasmodium chabaudi adami]
MSKEVCDAINQIEEIIVLDKKSQNYTFSDDITKAYCRNQNCDTDGKILSSGFISLLNYANSGDDDDVLENDQLSQYAILWLSYKIKQNTKIAAGIDDIYSLLIRNNDWFSEYREYIEKKKSVMKIYFSYLNNLYTLLKKICDTINKCNDPSSNNTECIDYANKCVSLYQEFVKTGPKHHLYCSTYCSVLSNLKNDYEKFRGGNNKKNLPEFKMPKEVESCESLCKSAEQKSKADELTNEEPEQVTSLENSSCGQSTNVLKDSQEEPQSEIKAQVDESSSVTFPTVNLTSINNANKLPYIAIPFVLIPIIFAISYKYLILGRKKMLKRKKPLKKIINLCDEK